MFDLTGNKTSAFEIKGFNMIECPKLYLVKQGQSIFKITQKILNNTANEFEINIFYDYMSKITKISAKKLIKKYSVDDLIIALVQLFKSLTELDKKYSLPYLPCAEIEDDSYSFDILTQTDKAVADYANMKITDVLNLKYIDYLILRKDAYVYKLSQTEKGKDYLEQCYCFASEEPDRESLRKQFGGN